MTSRERVARAFMHEEPDRLPIDCGAHCCSGMNVKIIEDLRNYYGLEERPVTLWEAFAMNGVVDSDLADAMGIDCVALIGPGTMFGFDREPEKEWKTPWGQTIMVPEKFNLTDDGSGGYYIHPEGDTSVAPSGHMPVGSYYFDSLERGSSTEKDDLNPEYNLEGLGVFSDEVLQYYSNRAKKARETGRYVVCSMGGMGLGDVAEVPGPGLRDPKGVRSITQWYMLPLSHPEFLEELFTRQYDIVIENCRRLYECCGENIDAVMGCAADFAHQNAPMISPKVFEKVYVPHYKRLNDWIHRNTNWKIIKHTCGAARKLIPSLIEAGFDALNPVQCSAVDMEAEGLKRDFGEDILFWGGGVDTQTVLPYGKPEEVREQVLRRCEIFGKGGGYIFNAVHNIQIDVPVENIVAMIDAVHEFNGVK